jgi:hypothetical protein
LQESVLAWHEGRHHTTQARRRDDGQGDPTLGSMAELHRGKDGPFLTSVATGRRAGVSEEMVDAVKRMAVMLVGKAERRRGEEEGDAWRRAGPASSSRTAPASRRRRVHVLDPSFSPHSFTPQISAARDWGGIPERLRFGG